jgi:pilus assembly protein CpaC
MKKANTIMKTRRLTLVVLIAWAVLFGNSISADQQQATSTQTPAAKPGDAQSQQGETPETLHLMVGRSLVITSPARVRRISIADPNIADTLIVSPTQIVVNGKMPGATSLVIWDESGQSQTFDLYVDLDVLSVNQEIRQSFPDQQVKVEAAKDVVVLSGRVSSQGVADKILEMAKAVSPKTVSLLEVPTAPTSGEILVQVRFAEVDRTALSQLGVNIFKMLPGTGNTLGVSNDSTIQPAWVAAEWDSRNTEFRRNQRYHPVGILEYFEYLPVSTGYQHGCHYRCLATEELDPNPC